MASVTYGKSIMSSVIMAKILWQMKLMNFRQFNPVETNQTLSYSFNIFSVDSRNIKNKHQDCHHRNLSYGKNGNKIPLQINPLKKINLLFKKISIVKKKHKKSKIMKIFILNRLTFHYIFAKEYRFFSSHYFLGWSFSLVLNLNLVK